MSPKSTKSPKAGKKTPTKKTPPPKVVEPSESEESEEEEEEVPEPAPVTKKAGKAAKKAAPVEEDSEEDDEDDSEEEEEVAKPKSKANGTKKAAPAKEAPVAEPEDDDDDDEDDDEEEESDEEKAAPAKMDVEDDDEDDDKDDDEDEEEDDEEEDDEEEDEGEDASPGEKRKAKKDKQEPAKKAKVADEDENATIFVSNLPEDVEEKKLQKFFSKKGIEVMEIRMNQRKPICHIDLKASDLEKAIELSGESLMGSELNIEAAVSRKTEGKPAGGKAGSDDSLTMFVKNLPYDATEASVMKAFPSANEIRIPTREDGSARGFAFLEFSSSEEVESTIKENQGITLGGRSLLLDFVGSKSNQGQSRGPGRNQAEAGQTKVLFVKNLSFDTEKDTLLEAFEGATDARIATAADTGRSRGFAFIQFDNAEDAKAAHGAMQSYNMDGRQLYVDFASEHSGGGGGGRGRGGGGFRGGRGGRGGGGGFGGGRGGGGRGGGFRGGRGGGGRGGGFGGRKDGIRDFKGSKKSFD